MYRMASLRVSTFEILLSLKKCPCLKADLSPVPVASTRYPVIVARLNIFTPRSRVHKKSCAEGAPKPSAALFEIHLRRGRPAEVIYY